MGVAVSVSWAWISCAVAACTVSAQGQHAFGSSGQPCWNGNAGVEFTCCTSLEGSSTRDLCFFDVFTAMACCDGSFDGLDQVFPPATEPVRSLPSGGRIFLLTSFSHDDESQWPLMRHFILHYRDHLGINPKHFMIILHSDSQNITGISRLARNLRHNYGIHYLFPDIEPYTSSRHMRMKHELLTRFVSKEDWIFQVDADELAVLPDGLTAHAHLSKLEAAGENVMFGLMLDRLASDGDIDKAPNYMTTLFEQYPLNCAVTTLLQGSDMRKVTAYKGYLRTTSGNHAVIGLSHDLAQRVKEDTGHMEALKEQVRQVYGYISDMLPLDKGQLHAIYPAGRFASIFHFKWVRGLRTKLERRKITEEYTIAQYAPILQELYISKATGLGFSFRPSSLQRLCQDVLTPALRSLSSFEFMNLFFNIKPAQVEARLNNYGARSEGEREQHLAKLLMVLVQHGVSREDDFPSV
ncbi:unnamed protein product [Polarella glacialis]|uniref:Glycosyltransferase family 92 protein n=1 Tax=Polarella glacialis TaxID=89957 RepID=A0A813E930_POLGL|nr:unnamed protein product [Polarella glacialis]CAE8595159.1 unnamed protein product [Polarella glacialis]